MYRIFVQANKMCTLLDRNKTDKVEKKNLNLNFLARNLKTVLHLKRIQMNDQIKTGRVLIHFTSQ